MADDLKNQVETMQAQLEASYRTNEQQLKVTEQQAELNLAQAQQIQALQTEKATLGEQVIELENLRMNH